jgi:N-acetylmuramic acid 6-phosphate etherase
VREALHRAGGSVKLALLLLEGMALDEAQDALDQADGDIRVAKDYLARRRTGMKRA